MLHTTGVWPEAIHPQTFGGCIGDGQHGWAAAEWLRWTRNAFIREEGQSLILGSGLTGAWLQARTPMHFGPTLTPWGLVDLTLRPVERDSWVLHLKEQWRSKRPVIIAHLPGTHRQAVTGDELVVRCEDRAA